MDRIGNLRDKPKKLIYTLIIEGFRILEEYPMINDLLNQSNCHQLLPPYFS